MRSGGVNIQLEDFSKVMVLVSHDRAGKLHRGPRAGRRLDQGEQGRNRRAIQE